MKIIINHIPLFGAIIGILLAFFALFSKSKYSNIKNASYYLTFALLFTSMNLLDGVKGFNVNYFSWIIYFFYPFLGLSYLLYANDLLNLNLRLKKWLVLVGTYWFVHATVLLFHREMLLDYTVEKFTELTLNDIIIVSDYFVTLFINVTAIFYVYKRVKSISPNEVKPKEQVNFHWVKKVLGSATVIYLLTLILILLGISMEFSFNKAGLGLKIEGVSGTLYKFLSNIYLYEKLEAILTGIFVFTIAVWSMRIPVFASFHPVMEEVKEVKKYAKSTLKKNQSDEIWDQIKHSMEQKKMYQNPTLRLNDLVQEIEKPLPHISQVINERMNMSFLDFVNQYRVEEAKELLCNEKSQSLTILAIGYEVGFNSKTTFYTSFKRVTGQTPSEYKKSKQNA